MTRLVVLLAGAALLITLPASARVGRNAAFLGLARPTALALVDTNGDGKTEIVSANARLSMSVFSAAGDGSFARGAVTALAGSHPDMATADFNKDGVPDYAVATYEGAVQVLLGRAGGGFAAVTRQSSDMQTIAVLAADFDGDGNADVAGLSAKTGRLTVSLGNGDGSFRSASRYLVGGDPWEIATADLNGDGRLDVLATRGLPDELRVVFGAAGGGFSAPRVFRIGDLPTGIATGDFNGDGKTDVAVTSFGGKAITILLGDGAGNFRATSEVRALDSPDSIVAADLTGDGKLDLAAATFLGPTKVAVLKGNGDGTFAPATLYALGGGAFDLEAADLNKDGKLDLVGALAYTGHVSVLLGQGGGSFAAPVRYAAGPPACVVPDIRGAKLAAAKRALRAGGCRLGRVRSAYSTLVPRGRVLAQARGRGTEMPFGSHVGVTVSKGRKH
jgi:FG-GAP-like repeat/PASTA domain/FG-GAP repeat